MATKQGPEALEFEALEGVTGGTGTRNPLGDSGWTPPGEQSDAPPPILTENPFGNGGSGGGDPDGQEGNDSLHGEGYTGFEEVPGPSDLLVPNTIPDLAANTPFTGTGTREFPDRQDEDGNALPMQDG
jgi:hypothetical protein